MPAELKRNIFRTAMFVSLLMAFITILFITSPLTLSAKVTGQCVNCHTMHNSQNGGNVARGGMGVGWDGSNQLSGGSLLSTPNDNLLVTDCLGCHSSTTSSTIITIGGTRIPIVYNTVAPTNPLAGGNFHWVAQDTTKGHNVYGIANLDTYLAQAPGRQSGTCGNSTSCHVTLAVSRDTATQFKNGCQGCHFETAHHDDSKQWYRFLKGHLDTDDYVTGIEDPNWEQTPTSVNHNKYKGHIGPVDASVSLQDTKSMSSFCAGCHGQFHRKQFIGNSSPWLRHPTDIVLPQTKEYANYDPVANYSVQAPVAWTDPSNPTRTGAVVMCLSCHRAHGSDQPDILRWNYNDMIAGTTGSAAGTGCFTCHTAKDGL